MEQKIKIYLDTSVPNFLFAEDAPELKSITVELFENFIRNGIYMTLVSNFVIQEINQTENSEKSNYIAQQLLEKEILIRPLGRTIYMLPPYIVSEDELGYAYEQIGKLII